MKRALIGILGVAAALAAGHLVAGFVGASASPFVAVGNTAIDLTPRPLKDFAVNTFGVYDKLVLLGGMAVVILALAVVAGLASRKSPLPGTIVAVVLGLVGMAAVLARPDVGQLGVFAPLASLVAGVAVFRWLHQTTTPPEVSGRRNFLVATGLIAVGAGTGQFLGGRVDVEGSRDAIGPFPSKPAPVNADFAAEGTPTFITPNKDFYRIDTVLTVPRLRAEDWEMRVHGMVDRELVLRYDDIRRRSLVEETITMTCVSNEVGGPYVSTASFVGIPLRDVLNEAGVRSGADQLFSTSADGWTAGSPVDVVMDRGLIAIGMNGEPLPVEHGFPVRLVVPGLYGYISATKWVVDLELTTFAAKQGYWIPRGWGVRGPIKTMSRIDRPRGLSRVEGRTVVAGTAWAQPKGVAKVEVRVDGGAWQMTQLSEDVSDSTWRMWRIELDLPPGGHQVECRATDKSGYTQDSARLEPAPDGATGWHSIFFTVQG